MNEPERIRIDRTPEDWLEHYLANWAQWMRVKDLPEGCPDEASGGFLPFIDLDFDAMCERMDAEHAEQTYEAIRTALTPAEQCAIHHAYLQAVFFVRDYPAVLLRAKQKLMHDLKRRGLWFND